MSGLLLAAALFLGSCAGSPPPPAPGRGTLFGRVSLRPHEGVTPGSRELTVYGDRRLRDVEFVDYGKIEFAVVYLEEDRSPGGALTFTLESRTLGRPRLVPRQGALGRGGRVVVRNTDAETHTVSCPRAGWVRALLAGEEASFEAARAGESELFVLDLPETQAKFFVAPGAWTEVARDGRWELRDLPPGSRGLAVWHPRFPPERRAVEVRSGETTRVDLELTVESLGRGD